MIKESGVSQTPRNLRPRGLSQKISSESVTPRGTPANSIAMAPTQQESAVAPPPSFAALDRWMARYQQADPEAPPALIGALSPALLRFFRTQDLMSREQAADLLQETWLRIHRVRHTYRPGQPVLPWVYAIARRGRVDGYRRIRRIRAHEIATEVLPEEPAPFEPQNPLPAFEMLVEGMPESQREVV